MHFLAFPCVHALEEPQKWNNAPCSTVTGSTLKTPSSARVSPMSATPVTAPLSSAPRTSPQPTPPVHTPSRSPNETSWEQPNTQTHLGLARGVWRRLRPSGRGKQPSKKSRDLSPPCRPSAWTSRGRQTTRREPPAGGEGGWPGGVRCLHEEGASHPYQQRGRGDDAGEGRRHQRGDDDGGWLGVRVEDVVGVPERGGGEGWGEAARADGGRRQAALVAGARYAASGVQTRLSSGAERSAD